MTKDEPKKWKRNKMRQFSMGHIQIRHHSL